MVAGYNFYSYDYGLFEDVDLVDFSNERVKYDSDWYSFGYNAEGKLLQKFPELDAVDAEGNKRYLQERDVVKIHSTEEVITLKPYADMTLAQITSLRFADKLVYVGNTLYTTKEEED